MKGDTYRSGPLGNGYSRQEPHHPAFEFWLEKFSSLWL